MGVARESRSNLLLPDRLQRTPASSGKNNPNIQAIWDAVSLIPRGQVATYGAVARAAGLAGRARMTGYALRMAPTNLHLPWHRVVGAGGKIVFPKTSLHFREQSKRLRAEKVIVINGRVHSSYIATLGQI